MSSTMSADEGQTQQLEPAVAQRGRWLWLGAAVGAVVALASLLVVRTVLSADAKPTGFDPPRFVAEDTGIDHVYDGEFEFFVGGGVAVFDCDGDGRSDLYFAGGANPASLYRNQSEVGGPLRMVEVAAAAAELTAVTGAFPIDVDSDGHVDLAVLRVGENVLLRGLGDCSFRRANEEWSFDGGDAWTAAFSAKWEDATAWPTLVFGNYLALDEAGTPTGDCEDNQLFRPAPGGGYGRPIELSPGWCTLSILFSDWDRSGRIDLRMANDRHYYRDGEEQLWRVAPGEPPRLYTHAEGWRPLQIWGMGIASHDLTGDGLPEVFITSQGDNKLQTLESGAAQPSYHDIAIRRGVTAHRPFTGDEARPSTAWHPDFNDVNNDGFIDLFISKGNVDAMVEYAAADPSNLLMGQADGTFIEGAAAAGILSFGRGRGAALTDLNLDGLLDLVEVNRHESVKVWRNVGWGAAARPAPMGAWIALLLDQPKPNVSAIGSWIEVRVGDRTLLRECTVGGGHAGGQLGWIHFGLGDASSAEVRVYWPGGEVGPWQRVDANSFAIIERGASAVRNWVRGGEDER
jgi:hypothetical protein